MQQRGVGGGAVRSGEEEAERRSPFSPERFGNCYRLYVKGVIPILPKEQTPTVHCTCSPLYPPIAELQST